MFIEFEENGLVHRDEGAAGVDAEFARPVSGSHVLLPIE